jgi:hypothetical protein
MNDFSPASDEPAPLDFSIAAETSPNTDEIERRVRRLENEVNALKDTRALEDRIVLRVTDHFEKAGLAGAYSAASKDRLSRESYARLLFNILIDARLMLLMFFDKRFTLAWTTHLAVWVIIPAILTSGWWFPAAYFPYLGTFLDKFFDLLLGFCVYRAVSRDLRRYRETLGLRR